MPDARSHLDLRLMVAAFGAVTLTFLAAYALTQYALRRVDAASDEIAFNSAPSIQRLSALRTDVRHTEFLLGTAVTIGDAQDRAAVEPALAQLNAEANAYLTLPTFPGEKSLWRELNDSIAAFNGAVQRVLAQADAGAAQAARSGLAGIAVSADRVSDAAAGAIEFNAQKGRNLALAIKTVRHDTAVAGYALNASCVALAVMAAFLVRRQLRSYGVLLEEHAALQESRATELESFAGRAAHDILNPVAATQMSLALAMKLDVDNPRLRQLLARAVRNLLRIRRIIDGLLQFARAGGKPSPGASVDVPTVIEDVAAGIRQSAEAAGIEVRVESNTSCRARCSVGVLTSVVLNLAQNAMKYMAAGGATRRITFRATERGGAVHVEVEDTGPGIPPELKEDIFLPYVRGPNQSKEGLGLGLATVKRLCEAHGGRVGVRSSIGQGSLFWIEIPGSADAVATSVRGTD